MTAGLDSCPKGEAEACYTNELLPISRAGLKTNLKFWCTELEKIFCQSPSTALEKLEKQRYIILDVQPRRDLEEFLQNFITLAEHPGTASSNYSLLLTAYQHINGKQRITIAKPIENTTLTEFNK